MAKQRTLKESFTLSSKGLHTGLNLTVEFCPAPENYGYKIQRVDVEGQPIIEVLAENVTDTLQWNRTCQHDRAWTLGALCIGNRQLFDEGQWSGIPHPRG